MRRQLFALAASMAIVLVAASTGNAASPSSGTIGSKDTSLSWNGQSFVAAAVPSPSACSSQLCDSFTLKVDVPSSYWNTHTGGAFVNIHWGSSNNNFDLYVYDSSGNQVGASTSSSGTAEGVSIGEAAGTYQVRVVPKSVVNSGYNGAATFSSKATSTSSGSSTNGGTNRSGTSSGSSSKTNRSTGKSKTSKGSKSSGKNGKGSSSGNGSSGNSSPPGSCTTYEAGVCSFGNSPVSKQQMYYTYGIDHRSWWWKEQVDRDIPNTGQRVFLPNPQDNSTLPVAVHEGAPDKVSALYFGLLDRGVVQGSNIVLFQLKIAEGTQPGDKQPEYNQTDKKVAACFVNDLWVDNADPQTWTDDETGKPNVPAYDESKCVIGKRTGDATATFMTFNLTKIAQPWGLNPAQDNNGIIFVPVIPKNPGPQDQEWQVNLQIPKRDDSTTPSDDYKDTRTRVVATIAFTSPAPDTGGGDEGGGDISTGTTSTTEPTGTTGTGSFGTSGGFGTPTTTTTVDTTTVPTGVGSGSTPAIPPAGPSVANVPPVKLPPVVWWLIPVGLLALWAIRQMVLEPVGGPRDDGVIAAIRRRNAAMRGMPIEEPGSPVSQAREATRRARSLIMRSFRRSK